MPKNSISWNVRWMIKIGQSFKLSEPVVVIYNDENLQTKVEKVLGHIVWLLEEAQEPDSDSRSEERVIKKHRSLDNFAGNSDTVDKSQ